MYRRAINVVTEKQVRRSEAGMAEWMVLGVLAGFSAYDLRWKKVSTAAVALFGVAVLVYRIVSEASVTMFLPGLLPGMGLLLVAFVTKESVGTGDGLVLCVMGLFCGLKPVLAVFGMALLLCALLAMILLICRRVGKKTELPFLPCLCGAYLLYLLW